MGRLTTYEEVVADGERGRLVRAEVIKVVRLPGERSVDVVHDGVGDARHLCECDAFSLGLYAEPTGKARAEAREARCMRLLNADDVLGKSILTSLALPAHLSCPLQCASSATSRQYSPVVRAGIPSFQAFSSPTGHFSLPVAASVSGVYPGCSIVCEHRRLEHVVELTGQRAHMPALGGLRVLGRFADRTRVDGGGHGGRCARWRVVRGNDRG